MRAEIWTAGVLILISGVVSGRHNEPVEFTSVCDCTGNHGVSRWTAKTDSAAAPASTVAIQSIAPADIFAWSGIRGNVGRSSARTPAEEKWYAVKGRVEAIKVEDDGDLHIVLGDASGREGRMVVEVPLGESWCEIRKLVFSWTDARFPLIARKDRFHTTQHPIVTAVGKAFYDVDHSGRDNTSNRRDYDSSIAVWEIHPVMQLAVDSGTLLAKATTTSTAQSVAAASPLPTVAVQQEFVTITKPVTIQIPYGTTTLPRGMKLLVVSRDANNVRVRYLDGTYAIPVLVTDAR
jgi:hypothetical protein